MPAKDTHRSLQGLYFLRKIPTTAHRFCVFVSSAAVQSHVVTTVVHSLNSGGKSEAVSSGPDCLSGQVPLDSRECTYLALYLR